MIFDNWEFEFVGTKVQGLLFFSVSHCMTIRSKLFIVGVYIYSLPCTNLMEFIWASSVIKSTFVKVLKEKAFIILYWRHYLEELHRIHYNILIEWSKFEEENTMIGAGKIKQYTNVLDKPLSKGKQEVLLFSILEHDLFLYPLILISLFWIYYHSLFSIFFQLGVHLVKS